MSLFLILLKSAKTEVKIVLLSLAILLLLPVFTVVVIASSGVALVGNALAAVNPITHLVELFDPDGNKTGEIEVTTNWPIQGYVTDEFGTHAGWRRNLGLGVHSGIDIANISGTPITPFMEGVVVCSDNVDDSNCGKSVKIRHEHNITSLYCHMSSTANIQPNSVVAPGVVIGFVGSTGKSTGPHVHLTTRVYGVLVNPRTFLSGNPVMEAADVPQT